MTKTFYITPYQSNNIKKIGFWALYATLEDDYAKPVDLAAELVVAYARLVDVYTRTEDVSRKAVESYEAKINPSKFNGRWL